LHAVGHPALDDARVQEATRDELIGGRDVTVLVTQTDDSGSVDWTVISSP
jgi:hypothetical protein